MGHLFVWNSHPSSLAPQTPAVHHLTACPGGSLHPLHEGKRGERGQKNWILYLPEEKHRAEHTLLSVQLLHPPNAQRKAKHSCPFTYSSTLLVSTIPEEKKSNRSWHRRLGKDYNSPCHPPAEGEISNPLPMKGSKKNPTKFQRMKNSLVLHWKSLWPFQKQRSSLSCFLLPTWRSKKRYLIQYLSTVPTK